MPFDPTGPELAGQLAAIAVGNRRLFERGQVVAVSGNEADLRVGYDARGEALLLQQVPIASGYVPRVGDWVAIAYEAGHAGAPWVTGPTMAADAAADSAGVGVFSVAASAPLEAPTSTVYFDTTAGTWRGWNGSAWVDFGSDLHNHLGGLQGGIASEYYHFDQAEHEVLQDLAATVPGLSGFVRAAAGVLSASPLAEGDIPATIARDSEVAAYFHPSTGHDHDGTDAKKVEWGNVNSKPSTFPPSSHTHLQAEITDLQSGDSVTFGAITVGASTVSALTVGNRNGTTYRAVFTEQGVNAENSAVISGDAAKGRTVSLFGNGAAYFMGRDVTNDVEFGMGCSSALVAYAGSMTNHGFELRTNNAARIKLDGAGNLGFFGVSPVGRQSVTSFGSTGGTNNDGTARARINDIIAALQNLGLFA